MKRLTTSSPLQYFLAIVVGYSIDFAIFTGLVLAGFSIYWANAAGFCVGAVANVIFIRLFVFTDSRFTLLADLQLSLLSNGFVFFIGMGILFVLVEFGGMNALLAKLLANGITFFANYIIRLIFFRAQ